MQTTISSNTPDTGGAFGGGIDITVPTSKTLNFILDEVTISGNNANSGGGGGIANGTEGTGVSNLTITDSTIAANQAGAAGGIDNNPGAGTTTIERSTISGNDATDDNAGGIRNGSSASPTMTVRNTTVSGNDAVGNDGGIANGGSLSLEFSTVSNNTSGGTPGGLGTDQSATIKGTILANNTGANGDCFNEVTSQGYNLIENNTCTIFGDTTGNLLGPDPLLGPLNPAGGGDPANGIPSATHELMLGSAALNSGGPVCPTTDQRGILRPQGAGCDRGAFEREAPPETTITSGLGEGATISNPSPTFGFSSAEPGATFECKVDGGPFSPCTSPTTIGPLADGMHNFQVRAKDLDDEVDPTPESRTFTVDTPPPAAPLVVQPVISSTPTSEASGVKKCKRKQGKQAAATARKRCKRKKGR